MESFAAASNLIWPERCWVYIPLCALSTLCSSLYTISWGQDPCCQYQVDSNPRDNPKLEGRNLRGSPVVLIREPPNTVYHSAATVLAFFLSGWRLYSLWK